MLYNLFLDREAHEAMTANEKTRLNRDLAYAKKHNLLVSVRMDRHLDEEGDAYWAYSGTNFMDEEDYVDYRNSGGVWDYVYPTLEKVLR